MIITSSTYFYLPNLTTVTTYGRTGHTIELLLAKPV